MQQNTLRFVAKRSAFCC